MKCTTSSTSLDMESSTETVPQAMCYALAKQGYLLLHNSELLFRRFHDKSFISFIIPITGNKGGINIRSLTSLIISLLILVCTLVAIASEENSGITADLAMKNLMEGNARFVSGNTIHPDQSIVDRRAELVTSQHPFAVIVTCSDSRVPPEIVFDQGLGDIFVVRTAGEVMDNV